MKSYLNGYLTAPAEYVPRDFIAEFFQQLCEQYLRHEGATVPTHLYVPNYGNPKLSLHSAARKLFRLARLSIRSAAAIALLSWLLWPLLRHVPTLASHSAEHIKHLYRSALKWIPHLWDRYRLYVRIALGFVVLMLWPGVWQWRYLLRRRTESELAMEARSYLARLREDRTVNWGSSLSMPSIRGMGLSVSRGAQIRGNPWTLPELVTHTRHFMQEVADCTTDSDPAIFVGIDEIDRIGSLEQAERFIGEIKTIFGVEKCYFLVAIAEDVGSQFARRAVAGRSIIDNAFDEVISIEPLSFDEASNLLLKRVPGFTDSFVYLVHALSAGLPRELIRVTRRLVDVNSDRTTPRRHRRLEDLAFALVREHLAEGLRAARDQMSRYALPDRWSALFENLRMDNVILNRSPWAQRDEIYHTIERLARLRPPERQPDKIDVSPSADNEEVAAIRVTASLSCFAYFGLTVIDAFADPTFDIDAVRQVTEADSAGSYAELAAARLELSSSPVACASIITRFREAWDMNKVAADSLSSKFPRRTGPR